MPSGAYHVTVPVENKIAERDQSFRNCVITMFIFVMLSVVLILATFPWRKSRFAMDHDNAENSRFNSEDITNVDNHSEAGKKFFDALQEDNSEYTEFSRDVWKNNETGGKYIVETSTTSTTTLSQTKTNPKITIDEIEKNETTSSSTSASLPRTSANGENKIGIPEATSVMSSTSVTTSQSPIIPLSSIYPREIKYSEIIDTTTSAIRNIFTSTTSAEFHDSTREISSTEMYQNESTEVNHQSTDTSNTYSESTSTEDYTTESTVGQPKINDSSELNGEFISTPSSSINESTEENHQSTHTSHTSSESKSTENDKTQSTVEYQKMNGDFDLIDEFTSTLPSSSINESFTGLEDLNAVSRKNKTIKFAESTTSLTGLLVAKYFGNESTTSQTELTDWFVIDDTSDSSAQKSSSSSSTVSVPMKPLDSITQTSSSLIHVVSTTAADMFIEEKNNITSMSQTDLPTDNDNICVLGSCKQLSSKILSFMNHSADPCEDFYEYACGGMEADPQITDRYSSLRVFDRIDGAMRKYENKNGFFMNYFNSCLTYHRTTSMDGKINDVKSILDNIGNFYTEKLPDDYPGIAQLIANTLLHNSPLLFDITLDVNEKNPNKFILRLGPPIRGGSWQSIEHGSCMENTENNMDYVDVEKQYTSYKSCRNTAEGLMDYISGLSKELNFFANINGTELNILLEIIHRFFVNFPTDNEIHAAYRFKNYEIITVDELENHSKLLNWTKLISILTATNASRDVELQIYFKNQLLEALDNLDELIERHELELNNVLFGLFFLNFYEEVISLQRFQDVEKQCMDISTRFLPTEASILYMSSFSQIKLNTINSTIQQVFVELKETLKLKFERAQWITMNDRERLLKKLSNLQMSIPDVSNFQNVVQSYTSSSDYVTITVNVIKRYRENMYNNLENNPHDPKQLWTYFAKPYQSHSEALYGLNLILIPIGAIEWLITRENDKNFDYLIYASLGNFVAHEMAHHFDANGIQYWNGTRSSTLTFLDELTSTNYNDYLDCHNHSLFQEAIDIKIPATNQLIRFTMPPLTLNERLSDIMGMRLAHDTLARLGLTSPSKLLPWLDLDVNQLFYLAYAQTYCTKAPLTASYISLYEKFTLPSRLRIFAVATNDKFLGKAWNCPEGSKVLPNFNCDIFPSLLRV